MTDLRDIPPPQRHLSDDLRNAALWLGGVLAILAPGVVVTLAIAALLRAEPAPCAGPTLSLDSCNECVPAPNGTLMCTAKACGPVLP